MFNLNDLWSRFQRVPVEGCPQLTSGIFNYIVNSLNRLEYNYILIELTYGLIFKCEGHALIGYHIIIERDRHYSHSKHIFELFHTLK